MLRGGGSAAYVHFASQMRMNAAAHELRSVDQQSRRYSLFQAVAFEVANLLADQHHVARGLLVYLSFVDQDCRFQMPRMIVELEPDKSVARRTLQFLNNSRLTWNK